MKLHKNRRGNMAYHLEGRLLEVCNCRVLCPCWIGEDPDNGPCDTIVAWHFDKGTIEGVDVAGSTIVAVAHVPGNILKGNWRAAIYINDKASQKQMDALLQVYTGKLGGPVADLVKLIGEVVSVEQVPITFDVEGGKGTIKVGEVGYAELEPYKASTRGAPPPPRPIFSALPRAPGFVRQSPAHRPEKKGP